MIDQSKVEPARQPPVGRGRTTWDFVSEELERMRRVTTNWYRVALVLLVIGAAGFSFVRLNDSLDTIAMDMHGLARQVNEINTASQRTAAAAADVRSAVVDGSPAWSNYLEQTNLNAMACKARGLEALESNGVVEIDVSQSGVVWGKINRGTGAGQYTAMIHCRNNMVNAFVAGPDANVAASYRENIQQTFENAK